MMGGDGCSSTRPMAAYRSMAAFSHTQRIPGYLPSVILVR